MSDCLQWLFFGTVAVPHTKVILVILAMPPKESLVSLTIYSFLHDPMNCLMCLLLVVAIERFWKETYRVYSVLEIRLSGRYASISRDYLAGKGRGRFSIADIRA